MNDIILRQLLEEPVLMVMAQRADPESQLETKVHYPVKSWDKESPGRLQGREDSRGRKLVF